MKVVIISGGTPPSKELLMENLVNAEIIIAADKGCEMLAKNNIKADYILGDFDSCGEEYIEKLVNEGAVKYQFKTDKDYTDSQLALNLAMDKGAKEIIALGFTGTRLDHTLGNLGLLKKALDNNIDMKIIDNNNKIFLIKGETFLIGNYGDIISFQSYCNKVTNLSIKGAKFPLDNYNLELGDSITISNEFLLSHIQVTFDEGILMVLYTKD